MKKNTKENVVDNTTKKNSEYWLEHYLCKYDISEYRDIQKIDTPLKNGAKS